MSNSVGHGLLLPTVLEHQIKTNSNGIGAQANSQIRRFSSPSLLSNYFRGQRLSLWKSTLPRSRVVSWFPQAVLATDPSSELERWVLPSRCPEGSKVFNNQALRTPFLKDRWYKDNGRNFYVKFPSREKLVSNVRVPEDLVQIQAYLRWERNGKQTYSPEQEKKEFEEARKELQRELEKGNSVDDIRKKIAKGEIKAKVQKQLGKKNFFTLERINRKKRDIMQLLKKPTPVSVKEKTSIKPKDLSALEIFSKAIGEQIDTNILNKKTYRLADKELLVPPVNLLPVGSISLDKAAETQFSTISVDGASNKVCHYLQCYILQIQTFELDIEEGTFVGMPFVLRHGENWVKDNDSDFYVEFTEPKKPIKDAGDGKGTAKDLFNIAADLIEEAKDADELGLAGILVWMWFMATRQLVWNKNYCVKPREISQAQDRLIDKLQNVYKSYPQHSELLRMIMSSVGRGGEGDVGQRIHDEILVVQALINYIKSDLDISVYWDTLNSNGITKERLLSYDRAIHNEPNFTEDQKEGLLRDLGNYVRTLKAVHSGADLESAISNCTGYISEDASTLIFRICLVGWNEMKKERNGRGIARGTPGTEAITVIIKDLLFLDIALDSTVRAAIERSYEVLKNAKPEKIMYLITLLLENLILSSDNNEDLIYCWKGWNRALTMVKNGENDWALFAKSVLDRTRLALASKGELYHQLLQPSAEYLGALLGIDQWAVSIFTEEMIRSGSAASLSSLINRIDPILRSVANLGRSEKLQILKKQLDAEGSDVLGEIRKTVLDLSAPPQLVLELKNEMQSFEMPWPGDEGCKGTWRDLVGAYPGRALSFVSKKDNLDCPKILGYPSKPIGLFIRRSVIYRSDSNGEDLKGYAGAGLYDSVPMDEEEKVVVDYSCDPLIVDFDFQKSILSSIARVGDCIEKLYGSPQDIEGVVRDGKIYVVQTRPQM
ncbi:hypothetical protein L1987_38622 [Smallanthus sonchifolius]|uniref:Uncharacterized protein n=1 Tax=Smallanthus sonchifolius TaxID=185202 RepID=A0ACB9HKX5_9ASTR|nr:hypothetical protein L1987_38622 [Smallanthus sonchifolius]